MVKAAALNVLDPTTLEQMGERPLTEEEKEELKKELDEDFQKQMEDQRNMGKVMLLIGFAIIVMAWLNGVVSWHFHYVARLIGLPRFPLPQDVSWFNHLIFDTISAPFKRYFGTDEL
mmetsp:Transcript_13938/g.18596  ORF Transcript_13938/g.18596 Transcript_13938/m.18596 type:complete len:117 (-) Transcript_13938:196-546(-)|eukprot:CAMPEP_0197312800 /NCGR_PEP_ID=MMETSP0891-20130614/23479_1 /TAXON_ID=44058 ORGANISM="Aureoumbra lagunensis, Strain CCMP1510" /NCGR_SAMPLE_ID=MMETSP0891 /ASSEMBLY_ACC=CAM_ASM_000534 /LENGTH=116 /DNA_ID=CAMNT_0042800235 /DNA_START=22 /DNA_END=372 /DNA_ORIENTATION=+